jgi:RHS repeat-associated protein
VENDLWGRSMSMDLFSTPFGELLSITYPSGRHVDYTYDIAGNVTNVTDNQAFHAAITHLPGGRPDVITGAVEGSSHYDLDRHYTYDDHHRLSSLSATLGSNPWNLLRGYFPNGQVSSLTDTRRGNWTFTYDGANRLSSSAKTGSPTVNYTYKENGALSTVSQTGSTETYLYTGPTMSKLSRINWTGGSYYRVYHNEAGQIYSQSYLPLQPTQSYTQSYAWYGDGNLASITKTPMMGGQTQVHYDYDEAGQRYRRGSSTSSDLYFDDLAEKKGEQLVEYIHLPQLTIELNQQGTHRVHYSDGLNTAEVVNDQGTIESELSYEPYGKKTALTGSPNATFTFNEKRQEPGLGTLYYGARHYDPTLRQFLSVDPLRLEGASDVSDGKNMLQPYVYAAADPVTLRDVQGLEPDGFAGSPSPEQFSNMISGAADAFSWFGYRVVPGADWLHGVMFGSTYFDTESGRSPTGRIISAVGLALTIGLAGLAGPAAGLGLPAKAEVGAAGATAQAAGGASTGKSFFEGARYTQKVLQQMRGGVGEFHSFPESVAAFESAGTVRAITGGDRVVRQILEIPGSYGGRNGVFQFIKEADGAINHRLFVPGAP